MSRDSLRLIAPTKKYLKTYLEACFEFKQHNLLSYVDDPDKVELWKNTFVKSCRDQSKGKNLPSHFVPATTLWLMEGDRFIGRGSIRHHLNANLERFGGHIGYAIRPSEWGKGYGTKQLKLLLPYAKKLGIDNALLTCNEQNIASKRIIETNGGILIDIIDNVSDGLPIKTCRFNIHII